MASIERFEDVAAWQKARELNHLVYRATRRREFRRDFGLCDQIRRAGVSIMSNIAEGFERGGDKEFHQFLALAKGSVGEVRSQLYVALDEDYIDQAEFDRLYALSVEVANLIAGFMRYLNASPHKGRKYK